MKHGATAILPLAAGAAVYGFAFGLLAALVGFPWWGVALMSSLVHAGSSQIVAVEQFGGTSAVIGAALAGGALNLVRRQSFWFQRLRNLSEYPAHLVDFIMRRVCCVASAGSRVFCV